MREFFGGKEGVYPGYAPATDNNDPEKYAAFVAARLGVSPDTPLAGLNSNGGAAAIPALPTVAPEISPGPAPAQLPPQLPPPAPGPQIQAEEIPPAAPPLINTATAWRTRTTTAPSGVQTISPLPTEFNPKVGPEPPVLVLGDKDTLSIKPPLLPEIRTDYIPGVNEAKQAYDEAYSLIYGALQQPPVTKHTSMPDAIADGFLRLVVGFQTPEAIATMIAGAGLAKFIPYLANLPKIAEAVAGNPTLAKGLSAVAEGAVPGAFAGYMGYQGAKAAPQIVEQAKEGNIPGAVSAGIQTVGDLAVATLAGKSAFGKGKAAVEEFPTEPARKELRPAEAQLAESL